MISEVWVPLRDEEGDWGEFYEISSFGRIRSLDRVVNTKWGSTAIRKGKIKSLSVHKTGYVVAGYSVNGRLKQRVVSRLVAFSFYGPPPEENMQACHNDGDKSNNSLSNIRWDTPKANAADKELHGTNNRGMNNPRATMTKEEVLQIKRRLKDGDRQCDIADDFGVHRCAVNAIAKGRSWTHLEI